MTKLYILYIIVESFSILEKFILKILKKVFFGRYSIKNKTQMYILFSSNNEHSETSVCNV